MKHRIVLVATIILAVTCFVNVYCPLVQAAADVQIVSHSSFYNSLDYLYVVGEVENTGDIATEFTKVTATFYGASDQVIGTRTGYATIDVLLPGRKSPFAIILEPEEGAMDVNRYELNVEYWEYDETKEEGLEILSSEQSIDVLDYLHVTGEIKNTGTATAQDVTVIATFYDSTGTVVGRNWEWASDSDLGAGETGTFDVELIHQEQIPKVASYSLTAEAENYALIPEFPTLTTMFAVVAIATVAVVVYKNKLNKK